jgi:nucleoside-diphosphate-sugar epimerase
MPSNGSSELIASGRIDGDGPWRVDYWWTRGHRRWVQTVVLTGTDSALGGRVADRLRSDPGVARVIEVDLARHRNPDLKARIDGADVLVHLGRTDGVEMDGTGAGVVDVDGTRELLDAAGGVGVTTVVLLSSATVYGAWYANPVPLTEDAPLRPNPTLGFATHKAEVERLGAEWRRGHPSATVAVLRATVAVGSDTADWLGASLWSTTPLASAEEEPPAQFVHLDDLAEAVHLAAVRRLDGPYNVAPDGWISGEDLRRLAGRGPSLRLSERLRGRLAAMGWKLGVTSTPPSLVAYRSHPWVVANDRLVAEGWTPSFSNEEAFVVSHQPTGWSTVSPQRRQEVALAATGVVVIGIGAALVLLIRRLMGRSGS